MEENLIEEKFGIKHDHDGIACFKCIISDNVDKVAVACPWDSQLLFNQVVNALNLGNTVTIDVCYLPFGGSKK